MHRAWYIFLHRGASTKFVVRSECPVFTWFKIKTSKIPSKKIYSGTAYQRHESFIWNSWTQHQRDKCFPVWKFRDENTEQEGCGHSGFTFCVLHTQSWCLETAPPPPPLERAGIGMCWFDHFPNRLHSPVKPNKIYEPNYQEVIEPWLRSL